LDPWDPRVLEVPAVQCHPAIQQVLRGLGNQVDLELRLCLEYLMIQVYRTRLELLVILGCRRDLVGR